MKALRFMAVVAAAVFLLTAAGVAFAADDSGVMNKELAADKTAEARVESAQQAVDTAKSKSVEQGFVDTNKANIAEKKEDAKALHEKASDLRQQRKVARQERRQNIVSGATSK